MKKLLYTFLAVSIIFSACEEDTPLQALGNNNPFAGNWSGVYSGGESGIWSGTVTSSGNFINGVIVSSDQDYYLASGSVSNSGTFDLVMGTVTTGAVFEGNATGNNIIGTWENALESLEGNWSGNKE